jgi:dTDP-4-dehydrorhamnose reductase
LQETNPPESELFPAPVPVDTSLSNVETKKILGIGEKSLRSLLESLRIEYEAGFATKN